MWWFASCQYFNRTVFLRLQGLEALKVFLSFYPTPVMGSLLLLTEHIFHLKIIWYKVDSFNKIPLFTKYIGYLSVNYLDHLVLSIYFKALKYFPIVLRVT